MNQEPNPAFEFDPELEARLVALILGEASDFEREQLQSLMDRDAVVQARYHQLQISDQWLKDFRPTDHEPPPESWSLPKDRRASVLSAIANLDCQAEPFAEDVPTEASLKKVSPVSGGPGGRWRWNRFLAWSTAAAATAVGLLLSLGSWMNMPVELVAMSRRHSVDRHAADRAMDLAVPNSLPDGVRARGEDKGFEREVEPAYASGSTSLRSLPQSSTSQYYLYDDTQYFPSDGAAADSGNDASYGLPGQSAYALGKEDGFSSEATTSLLQREGESTLAYPAVPTPSVPNGGEVLLGGIRRQTADGGLNTLSLAEGTAPVQNFDSDAIGLGINKPDTSVPALTDLAMADQSNWRLELPLPDASPSAAAVTGGSAGRYEQSSNAPGNVDRWFDTANADRGYSLGELNSARLPAEDSIGADANVDFALINPELAVGSGSNTSVPAPVDEMELMLGQTLDEALVESGQASAGFGRQAGRAGDIARKADTPILSKSLAIAGSEIASVEPQAWDLNEAKEGFESIVANQDSRAQVEMQPSAGARFGNGQLSTEFFADVDGDSQEDETLDDALQLGAQFEFARRQPASQAARGMETQQGGQQQGQSAGAEASLAERFRAFRSLQPPSDLTDSEKDEQAVDKYSVVGKEARAAAGRASGLELASPERADSERGEARGGRRRGQGLESTEVAGESPTQLADGVIDVSGDLSRNASQFGRAGTPAKRRALARTVGLAETAASQQPFSTFSLHVSDVAFKLAMDALAQGQWPDAEKVRIEEFVNAFDYRDPLPSMQERVAFRMEQSTHPFLLQRNVMRIALRTSAAGRSSTTPVRLTLLLDNSGSMERPDRRDTVRRAFAALTSQCRPGDKITLISFASTARLLADRIDGSQASQLVDALEHLPSEGGTNIEAALQLAFEKAIEQRDPRSQNRIVLLTDGAVNLGDANPQSLSELVVQMRDAGIAFDAAGISARDLNDEVLEAMTRQGDGRYYLLDSAESAGTDFARQIAGALRPSARNVKVQVEFNPERVQSYKLLGFEKHRLKKEDFRNDSVDAAEMAAAEAGVAVYQFEPNASGTGDVGRVWVRFQDVSTGLMVEKSWPIPFEPSPPRIEQASSSLRVATTAALFAAKLRGEALGEYYQMSDLAGLIAGLSGDMRTLPRVEQLRNMIESARQLSESNH